MSDPVRGEMKFDERIRRRRDERDRVWLVVYGGKKRRK